MIEILKKPDAKIWKARIEIAGKTKKDMFDERAKRMRQMFKGDHFPNAPEGDYIVINYCYAIIKAILPQIYFQDPYIFLYAGDGKTTDEAVKIAESVVNHFWYTMKIKRQIKKIALDALIYGFGLGKIGYNTETIKNKLESGVDHNELIKAEYPYFKRTSPLHIVFDPDATSIDDIRWLAVNYFLPLEDVKKNYKNTKDLKGDYYNVDRGFVETQRYSNDVQNDIKRLSVWEIQNKVDNTIMMVADSADDYLKNIDNPYKMEGFNYKFLYLNEVPDEIYPLSDLEQIKDIVLELDKTETQLLNHRGKGQRKIISEEGIWSSDEQRENFFNNEDMQNAEVRQNMIERVKVFDSSTIDASLYNIQTELKDNLYKISATAENQLSSDSTTQKTATEINKIDANSQIRNSDRIDSMLDFVTDTADALISILQQFMSKKVSVKYNGSFEEFSKEYIQGKLNVRIRVGDMLKPNQNEARATISQNLAETISAVDENNLPLVNRKVLLKKYYDTFGYTAAEIEELLTVAPPIPPPQQPQQEQQQGGQLDSNTIQQLLEAVPGAFPQQQTPPQQMPMEQLPPELLGDGGLY